MSVPVGFAIARQRIATVSTEAPTVGSGLLVRHEWWVELALAGSAVQTIGLIALWYAIGILGKFQRVESGVRKPVPSANDFLIGIEQHVAARNTFIHLSAHLVLLLNGVIRHTSIIRYECYLVKW